MSAAAGAVTADEDVVAGIARFIGARLGADDLRVSAFRRSVEGFSWETYALSVAWTEDGTARDRDLIVHRLPEAGLLRPYRVRPLFELRRAVFGLEGVPIPETLWLDEEGSATGRPLYVVAAIAGEVPTQWTSDASFRDDRERAEIARQLMGIAAAIHSAPIEVAPEGLRGVGDQDPIGEVRYWHDLYASEGLGPVPALDWGFAWLLANADRVSERRAVLHGDLRTGNYIVRDGRIVALLDWEEAHLGDPVQDLAHCALRLFRGRTRQPSGLVSLGELLDLYEQAAGWAVPRDAFHFWTVFEAVYTAVTQHRAASIFAAAETDDVRYAALGYQAHYNHRYVIDAIEAAEAGEPPT